MRLIANELIHGVTRENVFSLVRECVEGCGYWAGSIFLSDDKGTSSIDLFSKRLNETFTDTLSPSVGTVRITALDAIRSLRVRIYCMDDWQKLGLGHFPGLTPCEVGEAVIRYLLRTTESPERAAAWQSADEIRRFDFSTDTNGVIDYIMSGVDWRRGEQRHIDGLSLEGVHRPWDNWRATLHLVPLITIWGTQISIWIDLTHVSRMAGDDLRKTSTARIYIQQTEPGRCTALLYKTEEARFSEKEFDESFRLAASRIIGQWWQELMSNWKGEYVLVQLATGRKGVDVDEHGNWVSSEESNDLFFRFVSDKQFRHEAVQTTKEILQAWQDIQQAQPAQEDSEPLVKQGDELMKYAAQGLIAIWQAVDLTCIDMGWNWVKEDQSKSYSKVYAGPEGVSTRHVGILFNAAVTTKPQYILAPDGVASLTATQRAEAKLFIEGVKEALFIGLGSATEDGYRESDFKRLLMLPDPILARVGTEEQSPLIIGANIAASDELSGLLKPIVLNWRISQLTKWVEDFRNDTNGSIMLFYSQAKGYIDIYASPFALVGMSCERPVNGAIELRPYILEGATPSAIAELQNWRTALEEAMAERQRLAATADIVPVEDMPRTVGKPAENPERRKKKDTIRKLVMEGHTLRYIADNNIDIPYSTARMLRNELIEEGQLPQEVKKTRKKLGPNSI